MKRIDFFRQLFLGSTLLLIPKPSEQRTNARLAEIRLSSPYIAGYQFYDGCEVEKKLKEEEPLMLKREPQNNFDEYAIEVFYRQIKLGYLPKAENRVIARMMDQGMVVIARMLKVKAEAIVYRKFKTNPIL